MYKLVSLDEVETALIKGDLLAYDSETHNYKTKGFYGNVELAQFYQSHLDKVLLVRKPDVVRLAALLDQHKLVAHIGHYDLSTIQDQLGCKWHPKSFSDTFYGARIAYPKLASFTLDSVMVHVLGHCPYEKEGLDKAELQKSDWSRDLTEDQLLYAAIDVFYLLDIWADMEKAAKTISYNLDSLFTGYCLDFQQSGMPVELDKLSEQYNSNLDKIEEIDVPINVNSFKQVRNYIAREESDGLALARYTLEGNEKAANVQETRRLLKQNNYLDKFDSPTGRIYGKFAPTARSGRSTCKDQNLQQIPRLTKGVFGVKPDSGRILTSADYPQLELRGACIITYESRMEELFRANEDLHAYVAKILFGVGYTKVQRYIAKTCNFNLLYGGGWKLLGNILIQQAGIHLSDFALKRIRDNWLKIFPAIANWHSKGISAWRAGKLGRTPLGRPYTGKLMTDQLNIESQGFGAEVAKLATHYMAPKLKAIDSLLLCLFCHDNWVFEHDDDESLSREVSIVVATAMQEAWFECSKVTKIKDLPMPIQVFSGYNWGDIEEGVCKYEYEQL